MKDWTDEEWEEWKSLEDWIEKEWYEEGMEEWTKEKWEEWEHKWEDDYHWDIEDLKPC